jgi:hypothetical protein
VPSTLISFSKPACDEAGKPNTATMAATPMAMPNADSVARSRRVRSPTLATRARSPGPNFLARAQWWPSRSPDPVGGGGGRDVRHDAPVEHLHLTGQPDG